MVSHTRRLNFNWESGKKGAKIEARFFFIKQKKKVVYRAEACSGWLSSSRNKKKAGGCYSLPFSITQSLFIHVPFF